MSDHLIKSDKLLGSDLGKNIIIKKSDTKNEIQKPKDKTRTSCLRWIMLVLLCNFYFGPYYCYDNFGPIETEMKAQLKINSEEFLLLYSVYSWTGCFMPFVFGIMMDKIGVGITLVIFSIINTAGQFVVWYGAKTLDFDIMVVGRIIFGFTGDAMSVA